jgi:hypothetical protein
VETLRCPKCLNRLVDGGAKRCEACGARLRSRGRSAPAGDEIAARPRLLVERELQARIEAQTASGFRQRRRAAKTARRIAALPPSLFEAAAIIDTGNGSWNAASAPSPVVIDLPVSAIHDMMPLRVESEVVRVSEPEPLALVAPVIEITSLDSVADEAAPAEPEPAAEAAPAEPPPSRAHRRRAVRVEHRWRLRRTSRPPADDPPAVAPAESDVAPLVEEMVAEPVVATAEPEPLVVTEPEPEPEPVVVTAEPEPLVVVEPEPEPEPVVVTAEPEPLVVTEPEPEPEPVVATAEPERVRKPRWNPASIAPRDAADWQPSTSLWARQVFDARSKPQPTVSWPRPYEAAPARDHVDAEVAEPARAD